MGISWFWNQAQFYKQTSGIDSFSRFLMKNCVCQEQELDNPAGLSAQMKSGKFWGQKYTAVYLNQGRILRQRLGCIIFELIFTIQHCGCCTKYFIKENKSKLKIRKKLENIYHFLKWKFDFQLLIWVQLNFSPIWMIMLETCEWSRFCFQILMHSTVRYSNTIELCLRNLYLHSLLYINFYNRSLFYVVMEADMGLDRNLYSSAFILDVLVSAVGSIGNYLSCETC